VPRYVAYSPVARETCSWMHGLYELPELHKPDYVMGMHNSAGCPPSDGTARAEHFAAHCNIKQFISDSVLINAVTHRGYSVNRHLTRMVVPFARVATADK
jgi:hypothetical protein